MKMNSLFKSNNAVGVNYTNSKKQDVSLVIDIDNERQTFTVYRTDVRPFSTCFPTDINSFISEMIGCTDMTEFKDFADAVASAIH